MLFSSHFGIILAFISLHVCCGAEDLTSPNRSLYILRLYFADACSQQVSLCDGLIGLTYTQCEVVEQHCRGSTQFIDFKISFSKFVNSEQISNNITTLMSYKGSSILRKEIIDVNECINDQYFCSINAVCVNTFGTYKCLCRNGYTDSQTSSYPGEKCVKKCHEKLCPSYTTCLEGKEEDNDITCACPDGYSGPSCTLPIWTVILISVMTALAAITGVVLCGCSGYKLFTKNEKSDNRSDTSSLHGYKPKAYDYDRFTDLGSVTRIKADNDGFLGIVDEESNNVAPSLRNDGLRFGMKRAPHRNSVSSSGSDPTPTLRPIVVRSERHDLSDVDSQPDYY